MTLTEFLSAQYDDEQRVAEAAVQGEWTTGDEMLGAARIHVEAEPGSYAREHGFRTRTFIYDEGGHTEADAVHIVAWQPSRVLAEIVAKRGILRLHARAHECSVVDEQGEDDNCRWVMESENCTTVALLAQPFRDRDGWDASWEVEG